MPVIALVFWLQASATLTDQFAAIAKNSGGRVGVFVLLPDLAEAGVPQDQAGLPQDQE